jgi:predicted CXXCH cytochrome family protein
MDAAREALKVLSVVLFSATATATATAAEAGFAGSAHDLSTLPWSGGEACLPCHVTRDASEAGAPLWNHELSDALVIPYESPAGTLDATVDMTRDMTVDMTTDMTPDMTFYMTFYMTTGGPDGGITAACLGCHDGTVALDAFGGSSGGLSGSAVRIAPEKRIGPDLSRDHPVGFVYDSSLAATDGGLRDPANAPSGLGGTIAEDLLVDGRMECSSCHDVHNRSGQPSLLVKSNARSALCLTCHDK